ncbi:hypothetical protein EU546_00880 [Candidatus Thorarchaeota archaeon]|nr:MAG: hypothetical protein EU546_00880 [Candidatus Thorarchaeota archaeon]
MVLFVVIVVVVVAWFLVRDAERHHLTVLLLAGLLSTYIVSVLAYMPTITEITIGVEEELRLGLPAAYPFSVQQYRDYAEGVFSYSIVLGWPRGLPVIQFPLYDDQSEFIRAEAYYSGLMLGILGLALMATVVVLLFVFDRYRTPQSKSRLKPDYLVLVPLQTALLLLMGQLWLWGGVIYFVGGLGVLVISSIPTLLGIGRRGGAFQQD